jgi:hypothetical protein
MTNDNHLKVLEKNHPGLEIKKGKWRLALLQAGVELELHGMDYTPPNNERILVKAAIAFWQALFKTGDIAFFKELGDRMDGKSAQAVHIGDADGNVIPYQIIRFADLPLAGEQSDASTKRLDS